MRSPLPLHTRVEAAVRDGNRIAWTPGQIIGRTYDCPERTRYVVVTEDRRLLKDLPATEVREAAI